MMKRKLWWGMLLAFGMISACAPPGARIVSLQQPDTFKPGKPFQVHIVAEPVRVDCLNGSEAAQEADGDTCRDLGQICTVDDGVTIEGPPQVCIQLPKGWELSCEFEVPESSLPSGPSEGVIKADDLENALESMIPAEQQQAAYETKCSTGSQNASYDPGDTFSAECTITPNSVCGNYDVTYTASVGFVFPAQASEADDIEDFLECFFSQWTEFLIKEKLLATCQFSCEPESVPTMTQWGILAMGVLLAGAGVRYLHRRKQAR